MPCHTVRIGLACNEGCLYCFADPELWADRPRGWGLDYANLIAEDWRREFREIRRAGYDALSITGGEPLLHPDLLKMVRYARLLGFQQVELQTNATLLTRSNTRRLVKAGVCSALISLPSHIEKNYNAITATRDYHTPTLEGIRHMLDHGVRVTLAHVLCTANYTDVPEFVDFVCDNFPEVEWVSFLYVQPEGRATQNARLYPDLDDLRPYWQTAMARCARRGLRFRTDVQTGLPLCMMNGYEERVDMGMLLRPAAFWADDITSFAYMQSHKRHGKQCESCYFSKVCYGFWNEYQDAYGDAALVPVVSTPRLEELFPEVAAGAEAPNVGPGVYVRASRMEARAGIRRMPAREAAKAPARVGRAVGSA
jgi:MoaA/NifB/PqqE/SkfB family radical SAM enzyme